MGNIAAPVAKPPIEESIVCGLLPIENINASSYILENLVFGCGGVQVFSYAGAIRVLEQTSIIKKIHRFSGSGAGAIVAALLAFGFDSLELQECFDNCLWSLSTDAQSSDDLLINLSTNFGWNSGLNFLSWFEKLLKGKSYDPDITFSQLYKQTGNELCVVLTNIEKFHPEYFHPKTTPDFSIRRAVLASVSIPVMFTPLKFGDVDRNHYVHGGLTCSYPIVSFDGWWLSLEPENEFIRKIDSPLALDSAFTSGFRERTPKSLGFMLIDKYEESNYKEFLDRLRHTGAHMVIPDTELGRKYKTYQHGRTFMARTYDQFRSVCLQLLDIGASCQDKTGHIDEKVLAEKITSDKCFTQKERLLISPECSKTLNNCIDFLKSISDPNLTLDALINFLKRRILKITDEYPCFSTEVNNLETFFRSVFEVQRRAGINLNHVDYNRTIGVFCGQVGSSDPLMDNEDRIFLFRQGWNATVVHLEAMVPF